MTTGLKPDRFELARLEKLEKIQSLGHDPWGQRFDNHEAIASARSRCPDESGVDGDSARVAGRIRTRRKAGKLRFIDLQDQTGRMQLMFSRGDLTESQWELMSALDDGDLIGADGVLRRTNTGEPSVFVKELYGRFTCDHRERANCTDRKIARTVPEVGLHAFAERSFSLLPG